MFVVFFFGWEEGGGVVFLVERGWVFLVLFFGVRRGGEGERGVGLGFLLVFRSLVFLRREGGRERGGCGWMGERRKGEGE